jgi:adenylate cyclase
LLSKPARKSSSLRWRWLLPVLALVAVFHWSPVSKTLDWAFFDAASRHPLHSPSIPPNSAIVLIDENTMKAMSNLGVRWPFPRSIFAQLVVALQQAGAERVLVDFTFFEESESPVDDALLAAVAAASPSVILACTQERPPVFWNKDFIAAHPAFFKKPRTAFVEFPSDPDGVARNYQIQGSLAAAAFQSPVTGGAGLVRWQTSFAKLKGKGMEALSAAPFIVAGRPIIERLGVAAPDLEPEKIAAALANEPLLTGEVAARIRGRTVFLGTNASGTYDFKPLPVGDVEPGILLHWTAWTNLAGAGFIKAVPRIGMLLFALIVAGAIIWAGRRQLELAAPLFMAGILAVIFVVGAYAALSAGWFFPPATPFAAVLLTLLGVVAETLWVEQARKREIQSMFGAYVDPEVVAQLVRNPDSIELGGERREATVFFSDLAGFTDLSEKLPPEQMVEVVNAYLEQTSECLHKHGAYVDKYIGDAVMAVFGVPLALPDHALAACKSALEAYRAIDGINEKYAKKVGVKLKVRIGLNTGEMIVGNLGSSRKKNYTVMGDAVNLASRLEGANKAFGTGILIGHETALRVQGILATRPLARLRVKGKAQAIEVHTLHGVPEELSATECEFLAAYKAGYDAYVNARFVEAAAALGRADGIIAGDLTTARLREECERYSVNPPPAGWEPILTLESK